MDWAFRRTFLNYNCLIVFTIRAGCNLKFVFPEGLKYFRKKNNTLHEN